MLSCLQRIPQSQADLQSFYVGKPKHKKHPVRCLGPHKSRAQDAWLALLKLKLSDDQRKALLGIVSHRVAPWFANVELLMDFLTDSYNVGGSMSLLALSGLFYLIQEKNLDYPLFYQKLYSLLDGHVLHSRHRSRFFRLLETFLASSHLPAALVASFIKRLSRLALHAPPAAIVVVIPWVYNQLKRHPACTFTIHREVDKETLLRLGREGMDDPFDNEEADPMETEALQSSLWEIHMLQSHYHPNVATIANIISEQFTKHAYSLEDFLDHSYGTVCSKWWPATSAGSFTDCDDRWSALNFPRSSRRLRWLSTWYRRRSSQGRMTIFRSSRILSHVYGTSVSRGSIRASGSTSYGR